MKNSDAEARRWLLQAENDLGAARVMLREGFFAQACFLAHQVAEKALKAVAYLRGDRYVVGHSLSDLISDLQGTYSDLADFRRITGRLDRYYLPTRYPDALPGGLPFEAFDRSEAEEAVEVAGSIVELAKSIISS